MAIGYTPAVEIYGANAALINGRLIDWEHVDAAGVESDQLKLTVNIEGLEGLPSVDGKIGLRVGYEETGLVDKGEFVVTRTMPQLFPAQLLIVATAAPFKVADETGFKARRSASYGPTTLGAIFRELATRHGFSPRVAPELEPALFVLAWARAALRILDRLTVVDEGDQAAVVSAVEASRNVALWRAAAAPRG